MTPAKLAPVAPEESGGTDLRAVPSAPASGRFRDRFLHMLGRDDPPEIVAASFAMGVAISFTPLIGFHWILALALALLLRLNKVDVLLGTLVINPLTLGPTSMVGIWLGRFVWRARRQAVSELPVSHFFNREFWGQARPAMRAIGVQWATGMFLLAFLAGAVTYVVLLQVLRRRRAATLNRAEPATCRFPRKPE